MSRIFNEQEQQQIGLAEQALRARGIDVDGEKSETNGLLIFAYFDQYTEVPVTVNSILQAANSLVDKLSYTSKEAKKFNQLLVTLSVDDFAQLQNFLSRKPLIGIDGTKEGFENCVLLVEWVRSKGLKIEFGPLEQAMNAWTPGVGAVTVDRHNRSLHWKDRAKTDRTVVHGLKNHALVEEERKPFQPDAPKYVGGKLNHASVQPKEKPVTPALDQSEQSWKNLAASKLRSGRSHSVNAELEEIFNQGGAGRSWRKVNDEMNAAVKRQQASQRAS